MINNLRCIGALGVVYVACAAVGTAQAADPNWLVALNARSEAMNHSYGLGEYARQSARSASSPEWLVALDARSDALNRRYGLGEYAPTRGAGEVAKATPVIHADDRSGLRGSETVALAAPVAPTIASADDGFAWDDAALSVVATLAVAAVLGAGAVSIRYRRGMTLR